MGTRWIANQLRAMHTHCMEAPCKEAVKSRIWDVQSRIWDFQGKCTGTRATQRLTKKKRTMRFGEGKSDRLGRGIFAAILGEQHSWNLRCSQLCAMHIHNGMQAPCEEAVKNHNWQRLTKKERNMVLNSAPIRRRVELT